MEAGLRFRPPNGFTDSREFSDAECDRYFTFSPSLLKEIYIHIFDRDTSLDLEVQKTLELEHPNQDKLASLLIRYDLIFNVESNYRKCHK